MVGLNEKDIIKNLLNNDYIISEKYIYAHDSSENITKKYNFFFIGQIYRLNFDSGGFYEINNNNFNNISLFDFEKIYIYFNNPKKDKSIRVQLKHFMDNFIFDFPDRKRHIILEKKL
jgi:hypothetical protein